MIHLVRSLLALPFQVLGGVLAAFGVPAGMSLLKAAWWISGSGATGVRALAQVKRYEGGEAALTQARDWLSRRPRVELAAFTGLLLLDGGRLDEARDCLRQGGRLGADREGNLELLEVLLAYRDPDPAVIEELARRLEPRRDLNGLVRKLVLEERMWQEVLARRFDAARDYAEHLLAVGRDAQASLAMWALETRRGRGPEAARHFVAARGIPSPHGAYLRYLAAASIDAATYAEEALAELAEADPALVEKARRDVARWRATS